MNDKAANIRKTLIVLNLAAVAVIIYLIAIFKVYPIFQETWLTDPLAEIHALSPLYYSAIALMALLGVGCWIWRIGNKGLHVLLLMLLAMMLWLTPYWLSGFVRLPDAPWHVGLATQIPQILAGDPVAFSWYAQNYPGSYVYHYAFINVTGLQPLTYIQFFPLVSALSFIGLCYTLLTKLFDSRVAFLALLLAIPGLHYIQLHASPHVIGALLMLTVLGLLLIPGTIAKIIAIPVIVAIVVSHPTTPLLLAIFLAAALLAILARMRRVTRTQLALASILVVTFVGWLALYGNASQPQSVFLPTSSANGTATTTTPAVNKGTGLVHSLKGKLLPGDLYTSQEYVAGTPFIYGNIYNLNRGIYVLYALAAILLILYTAVRTYAKKRRIGRWLSRLGGFKRWELAVIISVPVLLAFTLLLAEGAAGLLETGLTYIILALAAIIAAITARARLTRFWKTKILPLFLVVGVLFLTFSFPVVTYSIDAYSNFPRSEEAGLEFLTNDTSLAGKTVAGYALDQLALFGPQDSNQTQFISLDLAHTKPDLAVLRKSFYYYSGMRKIASFTDNSYTRALDQTEEQKYNLIYAGPSFLVYTK